MVPNVSHWVTWTFDQHGQNLLEIDKLNYGQKKVRADPTAVLQVEENTPLIAPSIIVAALTMLMSIVKFCIICMLHTLRFSLN